MRTRRQVREGRVGDEGADTVKLEGREGEVDNFTN